MFSHILSASAVQAPFSILNMYRRDGFERDLSGQRFLDCESQLRPWEIATARGGGYGIGGAAEDELT